MKKELEIGDIVKSPDNSIGKVIFKYTRRPPIAAEWALIEWENGDTSTMPVSGLRKFTTGFTYCIGDVLTGENSVHYEIINHVIVKDDKFNVAAYNVEEYGIILYKQRLIHEDDLDLYTLKE